MNIFENLLPLLILLAIALAFAYSKSVHTKKSNSKPPSQTGTHALKDKPKKPPAPPKPPQKTTPPPVQTPTEPDATESQRLGAEGEELISLALDEFGLNLHLSNVYLPTSQGHTTEVDMVVLTKKGIIVIESKNYSGWIFGTDTHKQWTQSFPGGNKVKFPNPIHQNLHHMNTLSRYLSLDTSHFYSFVIFGNRCTLKSIVVGYHEALVFPLNELKTTLHEFYNQLDDVFTQEDLDNFMKLLAPCCNVDNSVKQAHVDYIQSKHGNGDAST